MEKLESENRLELADCKVILSIAQKIAQESDVGALLRFVERISGHLNYTKTSFSNVLVLFTVLCTPVKVSMGQMATIVEAVLERDSRDSEEFEELANWAFTESWGDDSDLVKKTASDMLVSYSMQANELYGFELAGKGTHEVLFRFLKAKVLQYGEYGHNDVTECELLFNTLIGYGPFQEWYRGIINPFEFYWSSYGRYHQSNVESPVLTLRDIVHNDDDFHFLFDKFVEPLDMHPRMVSDWLHKIILPLVAHYNTKDSRRTFIHWIFKDQYEENHAKVTAKYSSMNIIITQLNRASSIEIEDFNEILRLYLASIFYDIMQYGDSMSSMDTISFYDSIATVLESLIPSGNNEFSTADLEPFQDASSFEIFVKLNGKNPLLRPTIDNLQFVYKMILTCSKLYPINKLTTKKFLEYSTGSVLDEDKLALRNRQALQIMNSLDSSNTEGLLDAFSLFVESFVESANARQDLYKLVVERFLYENLFDFLEKDILEDNGHFPLSTNDYFELVYDKFWNSFNSATNLNEKTGKLREANECVQLFDKLSSRKDLSEENKKKIVRIKHLMKALSLMKNFKITVNMNMPLTPNLVVSNFNSLSGDTLNSPVDLIALILEYNPKSYLAFEKLYKIVNYLVMFFGDEDSTKDGDKTSTFYFNKVKSACIESALIDDNFNYAYNQCLILFTHYSKDQHNLNDVWLTFYQVGKYISPRWFDEEVDTTSEKLATWKKQREVLSRALKFMTPSDSSMDNSGVIIGQWRRINDQIEEAYANYLYLDQITAMELRLRNLGKQLNTIANEFIGEATNSTSQAGEKISKLFVSGLGWAIGANRGK